MDDSEVIDDESVQFTQARFSIDLNLPPADSSLLEDARKAIRREYRDSAKWKRLRCRKVSVVSETESGTVFELEIGHAVEFDWTWEGALAFRPLLLREFEDSQATFFENGSIDPEIEDSIVWSGEVLEVDEATGRIFIVVTNPEHPPRRGSFYVRPFEFLAFLDAVYNEPAFTEIRDQLPPRLAAARGGIHPDVSDFADVGLDNLKRWWRKSWSVLWGPPGTGKTYTTGQQVAKVLADPTERILIVSTTNRATDVVAVSIGRAARGENVGLSEDVPTKTDYRLPSVHEAKAEYQANEPSSIGTQLAKRKELRPVLSHEQERLCGLELDGKPRLVRGVAGSGKTIVLAHWLMQTVQRLSDEPNVRIWAVFANRSLQSLIGDSIESAWDQATGGKPFPWDRVELHHIKEILEVMLPDVGLSARAYGFEYDDAAEAYLKKKPVEEIIARCDALFIDEAQDMGPNTLKLLSAIVQQKDDEDENSRAVNIFYDNAQNIYGRSTPKWSELGLDMRGRSTVMKESFRSTKPVTEFALNVLYRLQPPDTNPDHKELVSRGLIEQTKRNGSDWWNVRFNQVDGPKPEFRQFMNLDQEFDGIAAYCRELIVEQGVQPSDICLIYNGKNIKYRLEKQVAPALIDLGVELSVQANKPFERSHNILLATTSHSYKGYDSEVVIVPAADQYTAKDKGVLANNLYVAMTRARSILTLFSQRMRNNDAELLYEVIEDCLGNLEERPEVECDNSAQDDLVEILDRIGHEHRRWLVSLWNTHGISQEPLTTKTGEIVAEPLFHLRADGTHYVCFGTEPPRQRIRQRLEDVGVKLLEAGQEITGDEPA